jgi:putative aldouronate transport system substrate-binding protein
MLKAFKDGNLGGQGATIPFSPWFSSIPGGWNSWYGAGAFLEHAFVGAWGIAMGFYQINGTVKYGAMQPEFQDFSQMMRTWFAEGLVDPDFPSTDQASFDAKVTGGKLGSMVALDGNGIGKYMGLVKDPSFKLVGAPYPVMKSWRHAAPGPARQLLSRGRLSRHLEPEPARDRDGQGARVRLQRRRAHAVQLWPRRRELHA